MNASTGEEVDHRDGNKLDNRRQNLRKASDEGNNRNKKKFKGQRSSKYKGVQWRKPDPRRRMPGRWLARITHGGRRIYLGKFAREVDAARAYDNAARKLYGEFATLNFAAIGERSAI